MGVLLGVKMVALSGVKMVALFWGQNGGPFWVKFESTPQMGIKMGVFSGFKMGKCFGLNLRVTLKWGSKWGRLLESKWGNPWLPQSPTYSHYYHFT